MAHFRKKRFANYSVNACFDHPITGMSMAIRVNVTGCGFKGSIKPIMNHFIHTWPGVKEVRLENWKKVNCKLTNI